MNVVLKAKSLDLKTTFELHKDPSERITIATTVFMNSAAEV